MMLHFMNQEVIALTIAGSDSGGGAGVQADLKTFAAMGVHGTSVITSVTAQNTLAVRDIFDLPDRVIRAQFDAVHEDFDIRAAKVGMLSSKEAVRCVAGSVGTYPLVVDPVMAAESGGSLLKDDAISPLKKLLFSKATVVTPNISEAEKLCGITIKGIADMRDACRIISECGCSVLVKGGHLESEDPKMSVDVLYHDGKFHEFKANRIGGSVHGSGCSFASAIAAGLAKGDDLISAVGSAKSFITKAIATAYSPGRGPRVANQLGMSFASFGEHPVIKELRKVVSDIESTEFHRLAPEVGSNIVYAKPDARTLEDVAGLEGRVVKLKNRSVAVGNIVFGGSKHMATVVLAAMHFDREFRSAMNIKYSEKTLAICEDLTFSISSFSRDDEQGEKSTMEWGTCHAIKKREFVPDIIYDRGGVGKEPMIRIFGKNPGEVYTKLERILNET